LFSSVAGNYLSVLRQAKFFGGVFDFPPLLCALLAPGSDRVLFSIDYPFESTKDAVEFIECAPLSQGGFAGRANATVAGPNKKVIA
jgi:predicted TIM-barrel fold metal-dependent hydrolase